MRAQCGYKKPLEEVYEPNVFWAFWSNTSKDIIAKFSRGYKCYNLFTCGEYNSSLKKCIFMVHPIFKCLVEKKLLFKDYHFSRDIIIHLLPMSNKALKTFWIIRKPLRENDTKMKLPQSTHIELKLFPANFQNGAILSTPLFEPLNYQKK